MVDNRKNLSNIIVCMTPLQALIAERIIENDSKNSYDLIYITYYNQEKNKYYYDRISKKANKAKFLYVKKNFFTFFRITLTLLNDYENLYNELYVATIHDKYCHFLSSKVKYKKLKTYDDGFGNIYPNSVFYQKAHQSFLKKCILYILGINKSMQKIRAESEEHVTIYKNTSNIIGATKYIELFDDLKITPNNQKQVSFFLGQPLKELNENFNDSFINDIISKIKVDYYVPHPAEKYKIVGDVDIVKTDLIFEDFLIEKLNNCEISNVIIYSFFSTALFNLNNYKGVKVISVYNSLIRQEYFDIYNFIEANGIDTLEVH